MNRNNETFSQAPTIRMKRSKIPLRQNIKTTFNAGYIIPFFNYQDVLPGDTFDLSYSIVIRQTTAQTPTMDNAYVDVYFFSDPWRLDWEHSKDLSLSSVPSLISKGQKKNIRLRRRYPLSVFVLSFDGLQCCTTGQTYLLGARLGS